MSSKGKIKNSKCLGEVRILGPLKHTFPCMNIKRYLSIAFWQNKTFILFALNCISFLAKKCWL